MSKTSTGQVQTPNQRSAAVWSSGGAAYDRISFDSADAIEHCVHRLDPKPWERVMDLATGTGRASRLVARRGALVEGVDLAPAMLAAARANADAAHLPIHYQVGDAESLPFADASFDAIVSTFGVMFASRPEAAAAELARVCCKGGRIALTAWTPDGTVSRMLELMRAFAPAPPAPSPFDWGRPERVRALLGKTFDLRFEAGTSCYREPTAEAAWQTFSLGDGLTRTLASVLPPERCAALRLRFVAFHDGFRTGLGISVPRDYWLTLGVRR